MENREHTVRQLKREFWTEWARRFPHTPSPLVRALSSLRDVEDDKTQGVSFDEWLQSGAIDQLTDTLNTTGQKITQLQDQLARKIYLYDFLVKLLCCVDNKSGVSYPAPLALTEGYTSAPLDLNVNCALATWLVGGVSESGDLPGKAEHWPTSASQRPWSVDKRERNFAAENYTCEQTTQCFTQQQSRTGSSFSETHSSDASGGKSKSFTKKVTASDSAVAETFAVAKQTTFSPPASTNLGKVTSGQGRGATVPVSCSAGDVLSHGTRNAKDLTHCVHNQRYDLTQVDIEEKRAEVDEQCLEVHDSVCVCDSKSHTDRNSLRADSKNQCSTKLRDRSTTTDGKTAWLDRYEYSSQRDESYGHGGSSLPRTHPLLLPQSSVTTTGKPETVTTATCVAVSTQTDISLGVKEEWVLSATREDYTMFWNRKKPEAGASSSSPRDRDNSGILGRRASPDTVDIPRAPSARTDSPLNVQYLRLTDGFNIVLDSDVARRGSGQKLDDGDDDDSGREETYDNATVVGRRPKGKTSLGVEGGNGKTFPGGEGGNGKTSLGGEGGEGKHATGSGFEGKKLSSSSPPSSSSPVPVARTPVSRLKSDTREVRPTPSRHSPPPPSSSSAGRSRPLPIPRKKPLAPPPGGKQKPTSVFYVECDTTKTDHTFTPACADNKARQEGVAPTVPGILCDNSTRTSQGHAVRRGSLADSSPVAEVIDARAEEQPGYNKVQSDNRGPFVYNELVSAKTDHSVNAYHPTTYTQESKHNRESVVTTKPPLTSFSSSNIDFSSSPSYSFSTKTTTTTTPAAVEQTTGLRHSQGFEDRPASTTDTAGTDAVLVPYRHSSENSSSVMCESSQFGIRGLCRSSVAAAVEFSQNLTTRTEGEKDSKINSSSSSINKKQSNNNNNNNTRAGTDSCQADDMFSLTRSHNLSVPTSDKQIASGGSPGVYRKSAPAPPPPNSAKESEENTKHVSQQHFSSATEPSAPTFLETDIDSDSVTTPTTTITPTVVQREARPLPAIPQQKKPKQNSYENWTINRIVTRKVGDDDDLVDDDDSDSTPSPEGTLKKDADASPTGSKDSGLCLEVQGSTPTVPEVTVSSERGFYPLGERISSIDELNRLQDEDDEDDDYATLSSLRKASSSEQDDNISIASDIIFIPGSADPGDEDRSDSPQPPSASAATEDDKGQKRLSGITHHLHPHHLNAGSQGSRSPLSNSEDEQDSPSSSVNTSYDDVDAPETGSVSGVGMSARDNMLKMRHLLVKGILETETCYLQHLDILVQYKRTLEASCQTSQPVIGAEDIKAIFSNLQVLQETHREFVDNLQAKVNCWGPEQTVGDIFKWLVVMFPESAKYAENYPKAVATIQRCCQESQRFQELAEHIVMTSTQGQREKPSLEGALFKPVQRMQRNTLVLFDLIKHTPEDHTDQELLQKALDLAQHNLENFGTAVVPSKVEEKRTLVKSSFLVEQVSGWRKLRFVFLFSDLLVCTKMVQHRGGKLTFDCKWFIPMNALNLVTKRGYEDDMKFSKKDDIDELKRKLRSLKGELKTEMKKDECRDKHWSGISAIASSRHIEKLKKKIRELERDLILSSPKLPFKVWCDSVKPHTLLMTTDYEREEWREMLTSLKRRSGRMDATPPSAFDVQEIVNSVKELPEVNKVGSLLVETDDEVIYGTLNVTIHKLNGLKDACDTYCCLEMDSLGHFFMKARTNVCERTLDPAWNEDFELELEGSQTLRVLCYQRLSDGQGDVPLGRGALELSRQWLKSSFQEKTVVMNQYSLVLSVRYTAAAQTMRRIPSKHNHAVFGVKISTCAKKEGKTVPTIITACVQEVEKRGLDEMGIYRVSGTSSEVQRIKKQFDKNVKTGVNILSELPVHSVTSALKLYLRELPDPLFTEANYANFLDALKLSDAEDKEKCMLSLFHNHLPDVNYYTAVYLLEHLHRVSKNEQENKMTINNLSTIFGPTLLAPAVKDQGQGVTVSDLMTIGTEQCMKQSAVVYYFLSYLAKGGSLRRSSVPT